MSTDKQKAKWKKTFIARRAEQLAAGGKQLNIVLDADVSKILETLRVKHETGTYKGALSDLIRAAKPRRGDARSK